MEEGIETEPKNVQFQKSLENLKGNCGEGPFENGLLAIKQKYPSLAKLCPWETKPELQPDALWIDVSITQTPEKRKAYRGRFWSHTLIGNIPRPTGSQSLYSYFSFNIVLSENGDYKIETTIAEFTTGSFRNTQTQSVLRGNATIPENAFVTILSEFSGLVSDWKSQSPARNI